MACQSPEQPEGMILVPAGSKTKPFWIDETPVTVAAFSEFVKATHYKTQAENFGDAGVFDFETGNWGLVKGANYLFPFGKNKTKSADNHPVTQVSWNDAQAYCKWAGKRLPTTKEWDWAAQNGDENFKAQYPWGEMASEGGKYKVNFWQGSFPAHNTNEDGFLTTNPVGFYGKTPLGLSDLGGNVWQWCADWDEQKPNERTQSGGSYLCDPSVCHGFQRERRSSSTPETSLCHVGFRCVKD